MPRARYHHAGAAPAPLPPREDTIGESTLGAPLPEIRYDDFAKVEIRVGRIIAADEFPQARKPAFKLRIDFGPLGVKSSSGQFTQRYRASELVGRLVLAVVNFPPRQIASFFSEVLTLGAEVGPGDYVLLRPDSDVPLGSRIS
jgi:tRNA-binding protein